MFDSPGRSINIEMFCSQGNSISYCGLPLVANRFVKYIKDEKLELVLVSLQADPEQLTLLVEI